ncbi:hypothetical protein AVEN_113557-1, partial [Araneus ventricosus]
MMTSKTLTSAETSKMCLCLKILKSLFVSFLKKAALVIQSSLTEDLGMGWVLTDFTTTALCRPKEDGLAVTYIHLSVNLL